jgi:hypothetical protein
MKTAAEPRMPRALSSTQGFGVLLGMVLAAPGIARGAEPAVATNPPPAPPRLVLSIPAAVVPGRTNALRIRGQRLGEMQRLELRTPAGTALLPIPTAATVPVPDRFKVEQVGDSQIELDCFVPEGVPEGFHASLAATSPAGESALLPLVVVKAENWNPGFKPSGGFADAPLLPPGTWISGTLPDRREVAVMRLEARAGQQLRAEVWASRYGSTLDAALSLHDARGAVLRRVDDREGRDPVLEWTFPATGRHYLSLAGTDERAAPTHTYLLRVDLE